MPDLCTEHSVIDPILETWREALGGDCAAYRGHVYRMFNFCLALHPAAEDEEALAIAAAFHDLGIWSDGTFDYLAPSVVLARAYLESEAPHVPVDAVVAMVELHHKLRRCPAAHGLAVEMFRRADLVDVSLGLITAGLPRAFVREVRATFPNAGFHMRLLQLGTSWFVRHPLNPVPMIRW